MKSRLLFRLIFLCLFCILLASCQSATVQPSPLPPTPTSLPPTSPPPASATPMPADTSMPTDTPILPTATITASPEQPVNSLDEITGVWKGFWSNQNMLLFEVGVTGQTTLSWEKGGTLVKEWMTVEAGILTWGKIISGDAIPTRCLENPVATYQVYITRRGDQPESLRFVLVGTDNCYDRQEFFDGNLLTWENPD